MKEKFVEHRFSGYEKLYGDKSWELDAVEPRRLVSLLIEEIEPLIDADEWEREKDEEDRYKEELIQLANKYE